MTLISEKASKGNNVTREFELSENEIDRIRQLLAATEISVQEMADRMDRAKSTLIAVNRKYSIRSYGRRRTH